MKIFLVLNETLRVNTAHVISFLNKNGNFPFFVVQSVLTFLLSF